MFHSNDRSSPVFSANPSIRFKFCTAAPEAPFPRLSSTATSLACPSVSDPTIEFHLVGSVQALGRKGLDRRRFARCCNLDKTFAVISTCQGGMEVAEPWLGRQRMKREGHFHDHALGVPADGRSKQREMIQSRMCLHFQHSACMRDRRS